MRLIRNNRAALLLAGAGAVSALIGVVGWGYLANAAVPAMPVNHLLFATSSHCIACHSDIHTPGGEDISIGWQWRATMMANASRDPYWHAGIRREVMDHPAAQSAIEGIDRATSSGELRKPGIGPPSLRTRANRRASRIVGTFWFVSQRTSVETDLPM
jgi:hypothetical protein